MKRDVVPLILALLVAGGFTVANVVPFHSCWYTPLRGGVPYAGQASLTDKFETAMREGKVELYGFPFVYAWHGWKVLEDEVSEVPLGLDALIGLVLTLATWLVTRKLLRVWRTRRR